MAYHRQQGVDTAIIRIFNTYGPRMRPHDGRAIPTFMRQALQNRPITVFGDGSQTRSFCYVDDLIRGMIALVGVRPGRADQRRQPERVHAAAARRDDHRGHGLELGDRLRGAAGRTTRRCASRTSAWRATCWAGSPRSSCARACCARSTGPARTRSSAPAAVDRRHGRRRSAATFVDAGARWPEHLPWCRVRSREMPSTQQQPREGTGKAREGSTAPDFTLSHRDVRRKRPPAMAFLLKLDTLRKVVRIGTLGHARLLRHLHGDPDGAAAQGRAAERRLEPAQRQAARWTREFQFAFLVTVLLFARSGLYSSRGERPGMTRIVSSLFQVALVAFVFVLSHRPAPRVRLVLPLLRHAVLRRHLRLAAAPGLREVHRRAAAPRRLPAAGGARRQRRAHRGGRPRAARRRDADGQRRRLHLADAAAEQRPRLARHARRARDGHRRPPHRRGHHRRPRLPAAEGRRARRRLPQPRRARADRAVDDGAARAPRGVRARRGGAAVRAQAAGLRGLRLRAQARVRHRRLVAAAVHDEPAARDGRDRRAVQLARPDRLPVDAAGDRRQAVRVPEVPHDVPRRRPAPGRPRVAQRGDRRALQDARRPAHDARRQAPAQVLDRRAAAALQRPARRDVARRPAPAARARLRRASRSGTRSATS